MRTPGPARVALRAPFTRGRTLALLLGVAAAALPASCSYHTAEPADECRTDADCDDGLACNGKESCRSGACEPGDPAACVAPSECLEHDTGPVCAPPQESVWLVFVQSGGLYGVNSAVEGARTPLRLDVGLAEEQVVASGSVAWSPDGRYLTFGAQVAPAGGGNGSVADAGAADGAALGDASTGGAGVGDAAATEAGAAPTARGQALYAIDLSGAVPRRPIVVVDANVPYAWAPDGSGLLVSDSTRSLFLVNRTQTGFAASVRLTSSLPLGDWHSSVPYQPTLTLPVALWSPNSKEVAFLEDGLSVVSAGGIPSVRRVAEGADIAGYAWAPDGSQLLLKRGSALVLNGSQNGTPLAAAAENAVWSPNSRNVAYASGTATAISSTTPGTETLTAAPFRGQPCWSRDSSLLAVTAPGQSVTLFDVVRRAAQTLPYRVATSNQPTCWSPRETYFPVLTANGDYSFVVLDAAGVRSGFGGQAAVTAVYQSQPITYKEIFISDFANNDSAVTFVTGPNAQQNLTLVTFAETIEERVIATGENLTAKFSTAAGFLAYSSGDDLLQNSATIRELYLVDLRDGKSRAPQRIAPDGASGFISDVSWQPSRAAPDN